MVINIEPEVDLHSITTIDPGLIQISHDYGYMRAADALDSAAGDRAALPTQIAQLRVGIWSMENAAAGQPDPMRPGTAAQPPDPAMPPKIAAGKASLKALIDRRRAAGGPMPADIDSWTVVSELHPWLASTVNDAAFVSQVVPAAIPAQGTAAASITMRNTGTTTWQAAKGYALGSQNPQDNMTWGINRWPLPHDVAPGASVRLTRQIPSPAQAGAAFQWRMVQENVSWFGAATNSVQVGIGPTPEPPVCLNLRQRIIELTQEIKDLNDSLTGDPRTDARIRLQIAADTRALASVTQQANDNNCRMP
jgi:NTE family protein